MKTKFLLPVLAMIFAIGMSFTTLKLEADPLNDYIQRDGKWEAIPEQDCGTGEVICEVIKNGPGPFTVYDAKNLSTMKEGNGIIKILP